MSLNLKGVEKINEEVQEKLTTVYSIRKDAFWRKVFDHGLACFFTCV